MACGVFFVAHCLFKSLVFLILFTILLKRVAILARRTSALKLKCDSVTEHHNAMRNSLFYTEHDP